MRFVQRTRMEVIAVMMAILQLETLNMQVDDPLDPI